MLLSLNNTNIKLDATHITFGSTLEDMVRLNKGDKIALKRFKLKLAHSDRSIFQGSLGLKRFKLFIKYYDNVRLTGFKEDVVHTFTYTLEDDSYTFEANKDELVFQECCYDESISNSLKIYGIVDEPNNYVPIVLSKDSIFELDWVIQKAEA